MKMSKLTRNLGLTVLVALPLLLAACVYDTGGAPQIPDQPPVAVVTLPAEIPTVEVPSTVDAGGIPMSTATFTPGTYTASAVGYYADIPMEVTVTFSANQILSIEVSDAGNTFYGSGWALRALPGVPDQIIVQQSTQNIDAFTGGTLTRNAVIEAVEDTIVQAGSTPIALIPIIPTAPLAGDRFIPGYVEVTVERGEDREGNLMLYGLGGDGNIPMNMRISFGRDEFHILWWWPSIRPRWNCRCWRN